MSAAETPVYLDGLPPDQAATLQAVNLPWMVALHRYLTSGELLPHLDGQAFLCFAPPAGSGRVVLRLPAQVAVAALSPPDQGAVGGLGSTAATLWVGLVADIVQLLKSPRRLGDQAEGEPASDDRRRHIARGSRLAN